MVFTVEHKQTERLHSLALLGVTVIWGMAFLVVQNAIDAGFSTGFILVLRFALATALTATVFRKDIAATQKADLPGGILAGLALFGGFLFQTTGLQFTTPANNAFVTSSNIVLVPFLSWMLFRKRPYIRAFFAAAICFLGVWLLSFQPGETLSLGRGDLITFVGAISFACHTTALGYFATRTNTRVLNFLQLATVTVLSTLYFLVTDGDFGAFVPRVAHLNILFLGVFSTFLAYLVQTTAQKYVAPSKAAVIIAAEAVFAAIPSVLLGYEAMRRQLLLGGGLVLLSVLLVEVDFARLRRGKEVPPAD